MHKEPIDATCHKTFRAVHSSGKRLLSQIIWVIIHDEEASTARNAAAWFANPKSEGSAHICVDDKTCFRTLEDDDIPWAAEGANTKGFHIELAGFARWTAAIWGGKHNMTLERAAYKAALHCHKFNIPPVFRKAAGLKAGKRGISTHAECTKAFGGTHTDPGFGFPRRRFMRRVRFHYLHMHNK
jgi:acetylornithine deacetylase/succinyl-diaminopimelate desuccinylase-like protein